MSLRRSERQNKGVPPLRYTDNGKRERDIVLPGKSRSLNAVQAIDSDTMSSQQGKNHSINVVQRVLSKTSCSSSVKRRQMEAELRAEKLLLEAQRKLDSIEEERRLEKKQLIEMEKKLVMKELELERARLAEEREVEDVDVTEGSVVDNTRIQHWIDQLPTVICNNNKSDSCSRSGKGTHSEILAGNSQKKDKYNNFKVQKENESFSGAVEVENDKMMQFMARQSLNKDLPVFTGDQTEWLQFITQFKETTGMCGFTKRENMARLQKCLKGKARECVQALLNFTTEVDKVIETLEKRFGKPEYIIEELIHTVRKFPTLKEDKLESIMDFSCSIQNLAVTVTYLERQEYLSNPQLVNEIVNKLTPNLKFEWGKTVSKLKIDNKSVNILDFSSWFMEMADAVNHVTFSHADCERKKKFLFSTSEVQSRPSCAYCRKENHKIEECHFFKQLDIDKRWEWVKTKKVCFYCIGLNNHNLKRCRRKKMCNKNGCKSFHHSLLHRNSAGEQDISSNPNPEETICHSYKTGNQVLLRIAPVVLSGPYGEIRTYALFDEASTVTLIDSSLADELGAVGPIDPLTLRWTNCITNSENDSRKIKLYIKGENEKQFYSISNVRTVSNLNLPLQSVNMKMLSKKWTHLATIDIPHMNNVSPKILIGQDNIDLIIAREVIEEGRNAPVLSRTKLGWVIHGNAKHFRNRVDDEFSLHITRVENSDDYLHELVKESFSIENMGVKKLEQELESKENQRALKIMEETCRRVEENKWEIGLLWKKDHVELPNSKPMAIQRLQFIQRKMTRNPVFAEKYPQKIEEYLKKGYAEKIIMSSEDDKNERKWYLPHFGVINPKKPDKLRFVFDAASRVNGVSLNDVLLKGPDLLNPLLEVLFKFRLSKIAFTGDIQDMFHRVNIRQEDRTAQRFLWSNENNKTEEYKMNVMIFGAKSSPASAHYVMRKNAQEFQEEFPQAVSAILNQHYVDDYLDSVDTEEEALSLIHSVIEVHRRGGFKIRNWTSNSREILKKIPEELRAREIKEVDIDKELPVERVLGLFWNPNDDQFSFRVKMDEIETIKKKNERSTKRRILKVVMTVFDPFGFLGNFIIKAKILFQDIWRLGIGWDDEVDEETDKKWRDWLNEMSHIEKLKIPRCFYHIPFVGNIQLHVFCDAGAKSFSSVAYFRYEINHEVQTSFIMSRCRVSPLKAVSIPRLELQAAVMGSRMSKCISQKNLFQISKIYYWSDSRTVLSWLKTDTRKFKPFVAHRVSEILDLTEPSNWHWIPTGHNVADEGTRDNMKIDWSESNRWLNGPKFLLKKEDEWNFDNSQEIVKEKVDYSEMKKEFAPHQLEFVALIVSTTNLSESLPDIRRFSSWMKLIRSTAWICRVLKKKEKISLPSELTPQEIWNAEKVWIRFVQYEDFKEEMISLKNNEPICQSSRLFQLSPILDNEEILRVRGRLVLAEVEETVKYPIILNPKNIFSRLLLQHYHVKAGHIGQEYVLNEIRQKYWILRARAAIRSCWSACQKCKNLRAKPIVPEMSPFPKCRLSGFVRPFTFTGMDYFGPMSVTVGRRKEKRYGVLFTCLSTRAIHLEIAHSLNTDSAIMAIRRMIGRRGKPKKIYSDNGTNMRGADNELKKYLEEMNQDQLIKKLAIEGIEWSFLPPASPHMAGSWERLVKSVKIALKSTLNEQAPKDEVLLTLMVEAENVVNSRPLIHVSLDAHDAEALTPNHFLMGTSSSVNIPCILSENDIVTRKQWKISQCLAEHFWKRWVREYLPTLTKRTKWYQKSENLKINDVVIIIDSNLPRSCWLKGVITAVYHGKDGYVRSADVKTKIGTYRRPVAKLCILTISNDD